MSDGYTINTLDYIDLLEREERNACVYLDLKNPKTLQEKICWLNIYEPNILKSRCTDKILLRDYCKEKLGVDLCIPIIAIYDKPEDIEWNKLPKQFVIKCNHGSSMNIIVKDFNKLDINTTIFKLKQWLNTDYAFAHGFEANYHDIHRKIFIEEYKEDAATHELRDYKFSCFNGKPKIMCVISNLFTPEEVTNYYDMKFNPLNISLVHHPANYDIHFDKPKNFDKMIEYATKLSQPFKFVRVDFFSINDEVYLSELTFVPHAGVYLKFRNPEDNKKLGKLLKI